MFGKVLVTPTLLDSFDFLKTCPISWKDSAMKDFIAKIRREEIKYPAWVTKGQLFEQRVMKESRKTPTQVIYEPHPECIHTMRVAELIAGGAFQQKIQKDLVIGNTKAFFFGKSDVEFPDLTIDIKTTANFRGSDAYLSKNQHIVYLWINGKSDFKYVVAVWGSKEADNLIDVQEIDYHSPGSAVLEGMIKEKTVAMWDYIREIGLWRDYFFTFSKNTKK